MFSVFEWFILVLWCDTSVVHVSLVILDVARCYLWLFTLYINIEIGKNSC